MIAHKRKRKKLTPAQLAHRKRQAAKKRARNARERELAKRIKSLPTRRYGVILADPPWRFAPWSSETGMDRAADNHYPTQSFDDIMALDVPRIAGPDCVLFLWATVPMLPQALQVMERWGFYYKSNFCWAKDKIGTGYWNRNSHEHLLIGARGRILAPHPSQREPSLIAAARGQHSEKPLIVHKWIEAWWPRLPKIELYARARRRGWDAWGLEADLRSESPRVLDELIVLADEYPVGDDAA